MVRLLGGDIRHCVVDLRRPLGTMYIPEVDAICVVKHARNMHNISEVSRCVPENELPLHAFLELFNQILILIRQFFDLRKN